MAGNVPSIQETNPLRIAQGVRDLFAGRSNAVGTVTLRASQTTTTVTAANCGYQSKVFLMPTTANAAGALSGTYISSVGAGTFTITHASTVATDKTFYYVALG